MLWECLKFCSPQTSLKETNPVRIETILKKVYPLKSIVYSSVRAQDFDETTALIIEVKPRTKYRNLGTGRLYMVPSNEKNITSNSEKHKFSHLT